MDILENVRSRFSGDIFATETVGIEIEAVGENYARCSMEILPKHLNVNGQVMGGALFTLADFTFAVAADRGGNTISLSADISFLSPAKGKRLLAESHCLKAGRRTCVLEISIQDELSTPVASCRVTGMRLS